MRLAIVPGSFDPLTMGHVSLIREAASRYDEVVVAVMINPDKQYWFDMETRLEIARVSVADMERVRVIADSGMLVDLYDRLGASAVCKGWRNEVDYAYEQRMAEWNLAHNPRFYTELIPSTGELASLSSTAVREKLTRGETPNGWVHPNAIPIIQSKLKKGEINT